METTVLNETEVTSETAETEPGPSVREDEMDSEEVEISEAVQETMAEIPDKQEITESEEAPNHPQNTETQPAQDDTAPTQPEPGDIEQTQPKQEDIITPTVSSGNGPNDTPDQEL